MVEVVTKICWIDFSVLVTSERKIYQIILQYVRDYNESLS
jgi:hypothetical protein